MEPAKVAQTAELSLHLEAPAAAPLNAATKDFVAGALSGAAGIAAGQPLDTLRVRLQQSGCAARSAAGAWRLMAAAGDGWRGLFRGMAFPCYTTGLQNAVTFGAQGVAVRLLAGSRSDGGGSDGGGGGGGLRPAVPWQHTALAGCFAGAVQAAVSSPVELLKIRLQLQPATPGAAGYIGPWAMLRRVLRDEGGVKALTRGFGVTLLRDTPSYGLYFASYHWACAGLAWALPPPPPVAAAAGAAGAAGAGAAAAADGAGADGAAAAAATVAAAAARPLVQFCAGGVAGALAWASIYPIDVVKSRVQAAAAGGNGGGAWAVAAAAWRDEGAAAFTRGLGTTVARGFVVNAAIFTAFEALTQAMG